MDSIAVDQLCRSVVQNCNDLITVFDAQGNIVFMNEASVEVLGSAPAAYVGRNIISFVHPEEVERAALTLTLSRDYGTPPGNTHFRIRRDDGRYVALELTSGPATDGERPLMMTAGRRADTRFALEQTLHQLLGDGTLTEVMTSVCDTISWRQMGSRVAIAWRTPDGRDEWVSAGGLPDALCGGVSEPGSPWALARAMSRGVQEADLSGLSAELRATAEGLGIGGYWVEPVEGGATPALITVWTAAGGRPPTIHAQGMELARSIIAVIMRWTDQQARLDFAAFHDVLTRLPNRKAFFRALDASTHGAILYCDLDRFKPVNDTYGHAVGDEVLRQVAERLRHCVRGGDLVARIGGDEFAVLCPGSTAADAGILSERIRVAIAAPFVVEHGAADATARAVVEIGISIGVAHTTDRLDEASVAEADRLLYAMKARRRAERA